jgi:hypothetical protein
VYGSFLFDFKRKDPYTHFSQQPHNKLTCLVIFYYFFTKRKQKKTKKNNKILPATSAYCGAVVRNECRDHFSKLKIKNIKGCEMN